MSSDTSILHKRHEDCLSCRLISGFGVIGMGAYVYHQSKQKPPGAFRNGMIIISGVFATVGITRLLNLYPFCKKPKNTN